MAAWQVVLMALGGLWLGCVLLLSALLLVMAVYERLIERAWEPVEALSREIAEEQQRDASYISWLESTWEAENPSDS